MNLRDYQKFAAVLFGECPGCDECNACRVQSLVEKVWNSAHRSGASSAAQKNKQKCLIREWDWSNAIHRELVSYVLRLAPPGRFTTRPEAEAYLAGKMEAVSEWAGSREKEVKSIDWTLFVKGWIRREFEKENPPLPQPDLFSRSSKPSSPAGNKIRDQKDTLTKALAMSKKRGEQPASSTSQPTGSAQIPSDSTLSSRTPPRSH